MAALTAAVGTAIRRIAAVPLFVLGSAVAPELAKVWTVLKLMPRPSFFS
jgi:hypothetical protein